MTRTILLADDSVTIQKVVELTFLDQGVDVVAVGSGDDALERFGNLKPDLVIADIHMPGADGLEVCRRVKQASPETPVLLLVGTFEPFDASSVDQAAAQGYLKKPFDSQELLKVALDLMGQDPGVEDEGEAMTIDQPDEPAAAAADQPGAASERETPAVSTDGQLGEADVERIAKRVVELMADKTVRDVAWEVVPELAELLIRDRLRELETQVE